MEENLFLQLAKWADPESLSVSILFWFAGDPVTYFICDITGKMVLSVKSSYCVILTSWFVSRWLIWHVEPFLTPGTSLWRKQNHFWVPRLALIIGFYFISEQMALLMELQNEKHQRNFRNTQDRIHLIWVSPSWYLRILTWFLCDKLIPYLLLGGQCYLKLTVKLTFWSLNCG